MVDTNFEVLQAAGQARHRLDLNGAMRRSTGLNLDAQGISTYLFGNPRFGTDVAAADDLLAGGLLLDGTTNSYAETADAAALDILGDIDIRVEMMLGVIGGFMTLVSKWTPAAQQSYQFTIVPAFSQFHLSTSSTGANTVANTLTSATTGLVTAFRATLDVDNGAAGHTARYYQGPNLDGPWTELSGSPVTTAGVTTIFNSTSVMRLGTLGNGTQGFIGRIHRAQVHTGIDGAVVANPDFRALAVGTTNFVDSAGRTWNLGSAARVV